MTGFFTTIPLIRELRAIGRKPRLHPNGFVQFDLNSEGTHRLHFWPVPAIPAQKTRHTIHDHNFDMVSRVLAGELINQVFRISDLLPFITEGTFKFYRAKQISGTDTILVQTEHPACYLQLTHEQTIRKGETYILSRKHLHDSLYRDFTVTEMIKTDSEPNYRPLVAVPYGVTPDNDFRREVNEDLLWNCMEIGLRLVKEIYL